MTGPRAAITAALWVFGVPAFLLGVAFVVPVWVTLAIAFCGAWYCLYTRFRYR
jgi:hypothetical protein